MARFSCLSHFVCAEPQGCDYVAYPYPHAIQLPEVAANVPRQHKVLSPLHQRAPLRPRGHDKRSRGTVGCCVRALGRAAEEVLLESDRGRPRVPLGTASPDGSLKAANARTLLAHLLHLHLSRVLGHHFLAHATAVQPPSYESAGPSAPSPVCGIQAQIQVQVQATVGVRDTIPMS
jgi:hypothetical protein